MQSLEEVPVQTMTERMTTPRRRRRRRISTWVWLTTWRLRAGRCCCWCSSSGTPPSSLYRDIERPWDPLNCIMGIPSVIRPTDNGDTFDGGLVCVSFGAYFISLYENIPFFDAFYFCFITMTTIGFGDIVPGELKLVSSGLVLVWWTYFCNKVDWLIVDWILCEM